MEAVGQLTGGLAHDFNNLLAGISGAFEMIGVRLAQGRVADVERYLAAGQGATRRASALTHRLLAFSRRQTLSPRPIVVNRLLGDFSELVRRTVGPQIEVQTIAASGLWPALVDANQLENALLNLCINARDAMPEGGKITIETANRWLDDRTAREHGLTPGQYVTICTSDTGTGIDKSILDRVFDPFFTTKPIGQGTGLGLSMVYGFARQSNGHVRIYSEAGEGTMVCIYLPRHRGEEETEEPALSADPPAGADAGETVLVIDDKPSVRMLMCDALADLGYHCLEAGDGPSGLRILESRARIDLLVTDVGLPGGLNGRQVADAARTLRPGLKVLFVTGYAENAVLNHGHIEPGMEVLTKPFAVDELHRRVATLLAVE
jgi:CheY-like chemotaxis protein